jgi:hypothetical protein
VSVPDNVPKPPRYTGGQIAMIVFGAVLLLPGVCAVVFILGGVWQMVANRELLELDNPYLPIFLTIWAISFAIMTVGIVLIRMARRRAGIAR